MSFSNSSASGFNYRDNKPKVTSVFDIFGNATDMTNTNLYSQGTQKSRGIGKLPSQPIVVPETKKPLTPLFIEYVPEDGYKLLVPLVENIVSWSEDLRNRVTDFWCK
jgi:hypothetical protein